MNINKEDIKTILVALGQAYDWADWDNDLKGAEAMAKKIAKVAKKIEDKTGMTTRLLEDCMEHYGA